MVALGTIVVIIIVWSVFSRPLDRRGITSAMVFIAAGLAVGVSALGLFDISVESTVAERVAELALVLLLFSDAMRLDLRSLRHELKWPSSLLLIGLPLTLLAGAGAGLLVFPGMAFGSVFLLATMLAATDAALGQKVVTDASVPARVRQALDVESGLNDGLAVPFFLVALDIANAELEGGVGSAVLSNAASQIGWGLAGGLAAGVGWRAAVPPRRAPRLARSQLAADPAARRRAPRLRHRRRPRRQRLHRRLRRRHGVRARLGRARPRHPVHGGDRRLARRPRLDRVRRSRARLGPCRT